MAYLAEAAEVDQEKAVWVLLYLAKVYAVHGLHDAYYGVSSLQDLAAALWVMSYVADRVNQLKGQAPARLLQVMEVLHLLEELLNELLLRYLWALV